MQLTFSQTEVFIAVAINFISEKIFNTMGRTMQIVSSEGTVSFKGVFQPLRYKNKIYLSGVMTELGYDSVKKYLVLCSSDVALESVDGLQKVLTVDGEKFCVDCAEKVYFKSEPCYCWAIIHKGG